MPFRAIRLWSFFKELAPFQISEGALGQALQRLAEWLQVEVSEILKAIRQSPQIHIDETGWKVNGKGHWLWAFVNERIAHYKIDPSRAAKVPKQIIPTDYGGVIISDFYGVYNKLPGKKQKCLVHLMREMKKAREKNDSKEFITYYKELKRILQDAMRLGERQDHIPKENFLSRVAKIKKRLLTWNVRSYEDKCLKRLSNRFLKYWFDLVTFLEEARVSFNNNLCERQIRHNVIVRNRSYQNRSQKGAHAHEVLMSLIQTLHLQKDSPIQFLKKAYLTHRQGNLAPLLSS